MKVIENFIDREVVVVEVASFELGNSWTVAEKVGDGFLLMSRCIVVSVILVELCNFIVDVIIDVRLWCRA